VSDVYEIGIAWLAKSGAELGSINGSPDRAAARQEARAGLLHAYPRADRAVIYSGRSRLEGQLLEVVRR